jgi:hypothetical protein
VLETLSGRMHSYASDPSNGWFDSPPESSPMFNRTAVWYMRDLQSLLRDFANSLWFFYDFIRTIPLL